MNISNNNSNKKCVPRGGVTELKVHSVKTSPSFYQAYKLARRGIKIENRFPPSVIQHIRLKCSIHYLVFFDGSCTK